MMMELKDINDLLSEYGAGQLREEDYQEMLKLYRKYKILKELNITSDNHDKKVKSYYKHRNALIEEFGVYISSVYPLDNPTLILYRLYEIAEKSGLEKEQIKYLFEDSMVSRTRYPTLKKSSIPLDLFKYIENQDIANDVEDIKLDINEDKQFHETNNSNLSKQEKLLQEYHSLK